MSKIFRLYKEGATTFQDWNNSPAFPYNAAARDTIDDPSGDTARHEITSIPSPFARIDLIKSAFKEVCKTKKESKKVDLDGDTIFHKMVSDTLDVAEIFFNIDKLSDKVEIIKWDPSLMLRELKNSGIRGHKYLADVLEKYMESDGSRYNFDKMKNIYLLNYIGDGRKGELDIIGATSPATLFFSNANDLRYVCGIYFGKDKPFDSEYQPLYKRDIEFVKYLFALRKQIPDFSGRFPEVESYLTQTYRRLSDLQKKEVDNNASLDALSTISVVDNQQHDLVEVLGYNLYKKDAKSVNIDSDFAIRATQHPGIIPLVLPVESGNKYAKCQYTTDKWGTTNAAPYCDEETDLSKRILPSDGSVSPYLTINDLLEENIIRVPHTMNTENYFCGHMEMNEKELAYLLPVKPLFFEYFSIEDLKGNMPDGKPAFSLKALAGRSGVKATIRIPIKGTADIKYMEYTRLYYNDRSAEPEKNEGGVTELKFTGFIMPMVKFNNAQEAIYNVACVQAVSEKNEFTFYQGSEKLGTVKHSCRNDGQEEIKSDNYLIEGSNFDFVQVRSPYGYSGIVLPLFKQQRTTETFEFSIDLGTSNTHIEYRKGADAPEPLSFSTGEKVLCTMFLPHKDEDGNLDDLSEETALIGKDFIPSEVGAKDFKFPSRTVLSCAKNVDWKNVIAPFTLVNFPFPYDKRNNVRYNDYKYNIKWGKGEELRWMESYVCCLMLLIRNKVLLNDGNLQRTKITWFYPISMAPKRLCKLRETWDEAYKKYFGGNGVTCSMTESAAPIQYFFRRYAAATDLVNVDIGGGTTDIAFAKNKDLQYVTSFRFASNALFENSFSDLDNTNGIVDWFKPHIMSLLKEKEEQHGRLREVLLAGESPNNSHPANMASYLFGLKDISLFEKAGIDVKSVDFNYILREDEDFKIVFILFYTSIIYHIAQMVRVMEMEVPRHISFSGNGSKVMTIITTDTKLLTRYTKLIFEKVLGKSYDKELELLGLDKDSNPKESTCKGGIIGSENQDDPDKVVVFKGDASGLITSADTYESITSEQKERTVAAVNEFFRFVFVDLNNSFNFDKNFGVNTASIRIAQEVAKKDLSTFLDKGISQRREENEPGDVIEETFFYYPIKGVLQAISNEIYNSLKTK